MHCSSWICGVVDRRCLPCVCRRFQLGKEYDNVLCTSLEAAGSMAALRMAPRKGFMNRFRRKSPKLVSQPRTIPLQRNLVRLFVSRLNTSRLRWSLLALLDTPCPSGTLNAPYPDLATGAITRPALLELRPCFLSSGAFQWGVFAGRSWLRHWCEDSLSVVSSLYPRGGLHQPLDQQV